MKKIITYIAPTLFLSLPLIASAQGSTKTLKNVIALIVSYLNDILALLMGVAVVMFVWYVVRYFIMESDKSAKERGQYVMWSVIGFFIILSLWGLVNILVHTFNLSSTSPGPWNDYFNIFPK